MNKDPNVKIAGQKYAKCEIRSVDIESLHLNKSLLPLSFDQMLEKQIEAVWVILESEGYDITGKNIGAFVAKYVKEKPLTAIDKWKKHLELMAIYYPEIIIEPMAEAAHYPDDPEQFIKPFTFLDHCTKFILAANKVFNVNNGIEVRLDQAYKAGYLYKTLMVLAEYNAIQKKISANSRKPELKKIFDDLKRRKAGGEKPLELWPHFISALQDENRSFDMVEEHKPNPSNVKSWYITYFTLDKEDKEGANNKAKEPEKMKYENYLRRLSSK